MHQVIVGLLSTSQLMQIKVRLIHVNLLLYQFFFQFDHWVYGEYLYTPICPDHIGHLPNWGHVHFGGQRNMCRKQRLLGVVYIE